MVVLKLHTDPAGGFLEVPLGLFQSVLAAVPGFREALTGGDDACRMSREAVYLEDQRALPAFIVSAARAGQVARIDPVPEHSLRGCFVRGLLPLRLDCMGADIVGATIRTKPAARPGDLEMVVEAVTAGVPETLPDMAGTYIVGRTAEGKRMVIDEGLAGFIIDIIGPAPAPDFSPAGPGRDLAAPGETRDPAPGT